MWNIILTILILILMLGILIMSHELGHLIVAKAFGVYCLEYSIGFGPRLFHHKKKGGETDFSIRAIPLGGYVSMYSEEAELPDGVKIPRSRSIEGISHPRRALVMLAGIAVNLFLAVLFAFIYATCIPTYISAEAFDTGINEEGTFISSQTETSAAAYSLRISGTINQYEVSEKDRLFSACQFSSVGSATVDYPYLIDSEAKINDDPYIALFNFETLNGANDFYSLLEFYAADEGSYISPAEQALGVKAKPISGSSAYILQAGDEVTLNLTLIQAENYDDAPSYTSYKETKTVHSLTLTVSSEQTLVSSAPLYVEVYTYWAPFHLRLLNGCYFVANFFKLIGTAFAMIFTGNFGAVGSIVAAGAQISTLTHQIGVARTFFFYGGFLSLNLAIFNLLPFPGLDGYQLLVTIIEGVFKKEIPPKVKNIISYAGLAILLIFSVVIIFRDILGLF